MNNPNCRLAVLIDADNTSAAVVPALLAEISRYGTASIKRAYGDWTMPELGGWKTTLHKHAIQPIQQFAYTKGKNATDSALIIDAMDLLHTGNLQGFCLVSSDSDFTPLATRLREAGLLVYGIGERKTPQPFVVACDRFIYSEILDEKRGAEFNAHAADQELTQCMCDAVETATREDGWAPLAVVGSLLNKRDSAFDARNYGYSKLGELARDLPYLNVKMVRQKKNPEASLLYVCLTSSEGSS